MALGSAWARGRGQRTFARQFGLYLFGFATWLPPIIWFKNNVAELTFIDGPSMSPFLNEHYNESLRRDVCLNWKLYSQTDLRRGMIVTFK